MRPLPLRWTAALAASVILSLTNCSGGARVLPAAAPISLQPSVSSALAPGRGVVDFRLFVPGRHASSAPHRVFPAYVSASTAKVSVTVRGQNEPKAEKPQVFACTSVCSGKVTAPLGVDQMTMRLQDASNRVLAIGVSTVLVFKRAKNVLNLTLDGVPASVDLTIVPGTIPVAPASTGYVLFNARDVDGNVITPDGGYADLKNRPIAFNLASGNASVNLGVKTISGPGTAIPFTYDGTQHVGTIALTPSIHPGSPHGKIVFHAAAMNFVPAIVTRIAPPVPVTLLDATQVPVPGGATACGGFPCFDPNDLFFLGNSGSQQVALTYDVTTGNYGVDIFDGGAGGAWGEPPILYEPGFYGFFTYAGGTTFATYYIILSSGADYGGGGNPCPASYNVPIGIDGASVLYCTIFGSPNVYDATHSTFVAKGFERKIRIIKGTTYFVTAYAASSPQQVYAFGSLTPIAGAIGVGVNATTPATGYYGDSDGTVKVIGGATVATFSHAVENVTGYGTSIYADENGGIFGVSLPSGVFESAPLPIGAVVEVVAGRNGVPLLVEQDGTLDEMAI